MVCRASCLCKEDVLVLPMLNQTFVGRLFKIIDEDKTRPKLKTEGGEAKQAVDL